MARLELLDFQQRAADKLVKSALEYFVAGQDKMGGRLIPFVGQLKAVTGAGKTPILSHTIGKTQRAIVLWTTKFGSVVDQTVANLSVGGKYHHLLGNDVEVIKFSSIPSPVEWHRILEKEDGLTILVSTVAAWYTSEKDDRLNVHRVGTDWGDLSRWDQLKLQRKRPLWVVYDEAHNTTTEQVELLDELEPAGFFVASASPIGGKLQLYLTNLPEAVRKERIVPVSTRDVVDAQLLKSTISLADYHASTDEMLADAVARRIDLEGLFAENGSAVVPKAIYVVESSNTSDESGDARPIAIWKTLVNGLGVDPSTIAVCTNTKNLPKGAVRIERLAGIEKELTKERDELREQLGLANDSIRVKHSIASDKQQLLDRCKVRIDELHQEVNELRTKLAESEAAAAKMRGRLAFLEQQNNEQEAVVGKMRQAILSINNASEKQEPGLEEFVFTANLTTLGRKYIHEQSRLLAACEAALANMKQFNDDSQVDIAVRDKLAVAIKEARGQ